MKERCSNLGFLSNVNAVDCAWQSSCIFEFTFWGGWESRSKTRFAWKSRKAFFVNRHPDQLLYLQIKPPLSISAPFAQILTFTMIYGVRLLRVVNDMNDFHFFTLFRWQPELLYEYPHHGSSAQWSVIRAVKALRDLLQVSIYTLHSFIFTVRTYDRPISRTTWQAESH